MDSSEVDALRYIERVKEKMLTKLGATERQIRYLIDEITYSPPLKFVHPISVTDLLLSRHNIGKARANDLTFYCARCLALSPVSGFNPDYDE